MLDELVMTQADESFFWHMKHSPQALCGRRLIKMVRGRGRGVLTGVDVHVESRNYALTDLKVLDGRAYFYHSAAGFMAKDVMLAQFDDSAAVEAKLVVSLSDPAVRGRLASMTYARRCMSEPQTVVPVVSMTMSFGCTTFGLLASSTLTCMST